MNVLVTGANGFVGRAVVQHLLNMGYGVTALTGLRTPPGAALAGAMIVQHDLERSEDLAPLFDGVDAVVHLAAMVHITRGSQTDALATFRPLNVEATRRLALAAAQAGCRRFVFLSSLGVNGGETEGRPFTENDPPRPFGHYAASKLEAEQALAAVARDTGLATAVVRPPLVIGPSAPGNLGRLLKLVDTGLPLPFGALRNRRQYVGLGNLATFIALCLTHPDAVGETFLIADQPAATTPDIIRSLAGHMGKPARLVPVPLALLKAVGAVTGTASALQGLWSALEVSTDKAERRLGWKPPHDLDFELARAGRAYADQRRQPS